MRASTENIRQNFVGTYARPPDEWETPLSYAIATPFGNDGIYYQPVLELRTRIEDVQSSKTKLGKEHVLNPTRTIIMGIRVYVKKARHWIVGDGNVVRQAWDPCLELHLPTRSQPSTPVKAEEQASESLLLEV